jgi:hypothetical protein
MILLKKRITCKKFFDEYERHKNDLAVQEIKDKNTYNYPRGFRNEQSANID